MDKSWVWECVLAIIALISLIITFATYKLNKKQKRKNFFYKRIVQFNNSVSIVIDEINETDAELIYGKFVEKWKEDYQILTKINFGIRQKNQLVKLEFDFFLSVLSPDMIKMSDVGKVKKVKYNYFKKIKINNQEINRGKLITTCLNTLIKIFKDVSNANYKADFLFLLSNVQNLITEIINITNGYTQLSYNNKFEVIKPKGYSRWY